MKPLPLTRAEPLLFERPDSTLIRVPACTRRQMREVLVLDREDSADIGRRRGEQVAIFLQHAEWLQADGKTPAGELSSLLDALTPEEEIDILHAIAAAHHGFQPTTAVQLQQSMRDLLKKKLTRQTPI